MLDLLIVGAGPCGLACAAAADRAGLDYLVLEKACLVHTVYRFPTNLVFFSTPDLLSIGGVPFLTAGEKPTRAEALQYYRGVAAGLGLRVRLYEEAVSVRRRDGGFTVVSRPARWPELRNEWSARALVLATGYFDNPNLLGVPGEDLPHVSHYYTEGHPYYGLDVVVVGGNNSAVEAAMELYRCGARVTLVHRGDGLGAKVKPWVRPVAESHIQKGHVRALFRSRVLAVEPGRVLVERGGAAGAAGEVLTLPADFVFLLTGFRPDHRLLLEAGGEVDPATGVPRHDPDSMETTVPGLYLAGVYAAGFDANKIFIENGRLHGERIVGHLLSGLTKAKSVSWQSEAAAL